MNEGDSEGLTEKNCLLSAEIDRLADIIEIHKQEASELRIGFYLALIVELRAEI